MTRVLYAVEAIVCLALVAALFCARGDVVVACALLLGVAVVVALSKAESAATREEDGR